MDIREYLAVLKNDARFFGTVTAGIFLLAFLWFALQPVRFNGTLLLNVGRSANEPSSEYSYDSFYRLQADERFADTLVRWLANPRIVSDILGSAGTTPEMYSEESLSNTFQAKRLSSQVVEVRYSASTRDAITRYSDAIVTTTQKYTESLNGTQVNWFRVSGSDPIIRDGRVPAFPFLALALAVSLFIAFWAVFVKHFLVSPNQEQE